MEETGLDYRTVAKFIFDNTSLALPAHANTDLHAPMTLSWLLPPGTPAVTTLKAHHDAQSPQTHHSLTATPLGFFDDFMEATN